MAKYDGKFYVETDEFKDKSRATQEDEYGAWYSASEEGRRRYREIMLARHGVPEYFQSDEFKDKSKATCLEKYGVENISQTPEWKDKVIAANMERYGAPHFTQSLAYKNDVIERYSQMMRPYDCKVVNMENFVWAHFSGLTKLGVPYFFSFVDFRFSGLLNPCIPYLSFLVARIWSPFA